MANPVYSTQFVVYTADTPNFDYAVPEGFTAVIRQYSCVQNVGGFVFYINIANSEAAPPCQVVLDGDTGVANWAHGECRFVVPGGGLIETGVVTAGSELYIYVGGYLIADSYSR